MRVATAIKRGITAQVCDVNKALLSVFKTCKAGHTCIGMVNSISQDPCLFRFGGGQGRAGGREKQGCLLLLSTPTALEPRRMLAYKKVFKFS